MIKLLLKEKKTEISFRPNDCWLTWRRERLNTENQRSSERNKKKLKKKTKNPGMRNFE